MFDYTGIVKIGDLDLELGETLLAAEIAYTHIPAKNRSEGVVWICHGLTSGSDPRDWWADIVAPGKAIDTDRYTVISCNVLGSCYGSTGPASINTLTGKKYGQAFPRITYRDVAKAYERVAEYLGVQNIELLIGGSIGGQQALEWALYTHLDIRRLFLLSTNASHSPWGIAFNESQRMAIEADCEYQLDGEAKKGLAAARAIAMLSYRSPYSYNSTQGRDTPPKNSEEKGIFAAASYQRYQGVKLAERFDAHSYVTLLRLMDSHDISRARGKAEEVLSKIAAKTTVLGISSDLLFPIEEQRFLAENIKGADFYELESQYGHDGFILETEKISKILKEKLQ